MIDKGAVRGIYAIVFDYEGGNSAYLAGTITHADRALAIMDAQSDLMNERISDGPEPETAE